MERPRQAHGDLELFGILQGVVQSRRVLGSPGAGLGLESRAVGSGPGRGSPGELPPFTAVVLNRWRREPRGSCPMTRCHA